jgi:uncharacterized protein (DUF1697 family)
VAVVISMLRGVNLGSHHRIKMDALRSVYESVGLRDVQTYVQSGNVIFRTDKACAPSLAARIENGVERAFGFRSTVILRTVPEMRNAVSRNPFAQRSGIEPARLAVIFLATDPEVEAAKALAAVKVVSEEAHVVGREVFVYYPNGMARPKLSFTVIEKTLKTPATGRNWNTVTKLLEIAERIS